VLADLVARVEARLHAARMLGDLVPDGLAGQIPAGLALTSSAMAAVEDGVLGYAVVVARR